MLLNEDYGVFIVHVATLEALLIGITIHLSQKVQIAAFQ